MCLGVFWFCLFFFFEGKLTDVHSAHVTGCKMSMLHARSVASLVFPAVEIVVRGGVQVRWLCCPFTAEPDSAAPLSLSQHCCCCRPGELSGLVSFLSCLCFAVLVCSFPLPVLFLWPLLLSLSIPTPCCNECLLQCVH